MPQPKKPASPARKPTAGKKAAAAKPAAGAKSATARRSTAKPAAAKSATARRSTAATKSSTARRTAKPAAAKSSTVAKSSPARRSPAKPAVAKPSTARRSTAKPAAAKSSAAAKASTVRRSTAKPAAPKSPTARRSAAKPAAAKPSTARRAAAKPRAVAAAATPDDLAVSLGALRERLVSSLTLTSERLQEAVDDAVRRGRMTRKDAEELLGTLVAAGRAQTEALLADVEQLLGRGGGGVRVRADATGDAVLRTVDRARRRVGVGAFPILGYDELTAAQVAKRLTDLTPAQLRKVRDHERRNEARKSVLGAIDRKLA
jgi:hypothetical protein